MSKANFDLDVSYVRNGESTFEAQLDLDYLRKRINTYRTIHTHDISEIGSRYYEGSKTLVDLLQIFMASGPMDLMNVKICIDINTDSAETRPNASLIADVGYNRTVIDRTSQIRPKMHIEPVDMTVIFTYIDGNNNANVNTQGIFFITVAAVNKDTKDIICQIDMGDVELSKVMGTAEEYPPYLNGAKPSTRCFPAGTVLSYHENFPTPSIMRYDMTAAVNEVLCKMILKGEENK